MPRKRLFFSLPVLFFLVGTGFAETPIIVVDPGHGGKDPGAVSRGLKEKEIALAIAKRLVSSLKQKIGAEVRLTRSGDRFISLEGRDRVANADSCDLFISIHTNASRRSDAEGMEVYYLNKATDRAAQKLARRENQGDPRKEKEVGVIVSDLIQTAATEESAELARRVQQSLQQRLKKKHGIDSIRVKTALFYVLVGAKCPSLLIETGFITNPREGRRLKKGFFQKDLADAIAEGVLEHLKARPSDGNL